MAGCLILIAQNNMYIKHLIQLVQAKIMENFELDTWFVGLDSTEIEVIQQDGGSDNITNDIENMNNRIDSMLEEMGNNMDNIKCSFNIEDILEMDYSTMGTIDVIYKQYMIISYIKALIENQSSSYFGNILQSIDVASANVESNEIIKGFELFEDISSYLKWIHNSSKNLAERIGQTSTVFHPLFDKGGVPLIIRSSYNFCTGAHRCKNFYNKKEMPKCRNHHYVHILLKCDVESLITFINHIISNKIIPLPEQLSNFYLSVKTIWYVIKTMHCEINHVHYDTNGNSEPYHRNNIFDGQKKNSYVKNSSFVTREQRDRDNSTSQIDHPQRYTPQYKRFDRDNRKNVINHDRPTDRHIDHKNQRGGFRGQGNSGRPSPREEIRGNLRSTSKHPDAQKTDTDRVYNIYDILNN